MAAVRVYGFDAGQRYNWAYAQETVEVERQRWFDEIDLLNHMPRECVGKVEALSLDLIDSNDVYVG
jgi:hypothetical protein